MYVVVVAFFQISIKKSHDILYTYFMFKTLIQWHTERVREWVKLTKDLEIGIYSEMIEWRNIELIKYVYHSECFVKCF